jgi:TldD protein
MAMIESMDVPKILKRALKNGGDFAELYEEHSQTTQLTREMRRFEKVHQGRDAGVGLRVIYDGKTAYGSTNDLSETSLLDLAEQLAGAIQSRVFDRDIHLKKVKANWRQVVQVNPADVPLSDKARVATEGDQCAWGVSPHIQQVTVIYRDLLKSVTIANSLGEWTQEDQIYLIFFTQVVATKGNITQTGYEPLGGTHGFEMFRGDQVVQVAKTAAERAVRLLDAPLAPSGPMMVVLAAEAGGTMVHEAVGHGLEADLAREGLSVYQDKLGQQVGSPLITVIDDPTVPGKRGSFLFDDEGTPARRNVLIDRGILKNYMYNRLYAMRDGVASTGNGRRESYRHRPICRMTNTMIAPGASDPQAILRSVDRGLLVKRMGSGQVNSVNGDFVFEISDGFLIKNGKIDHPIRGATLTGNGPHILNTIDQVGNDLGYGLGTCGKDGQGVPVADAQPTLRIPEITIGGQ